MRHPPTLLLIHHRRQALAALQTQRFLQEAAPGPKGGTSVPSPHRQGSAGAGQTVLGLAAAAFGLIDL